MSSTVYQIAATATLVANGAIPQYSLVCEDVSTGSLVVRLCGNDELPHGVAQTAAAEAGDEIQVKFLSGADTNLGIAAGDGITIGAALYAAAGGEVDDSGTILVGYARQAAGAEDILEWRYQPVAQPAG